MDQPFGAKSHDVAASVSICSQSDCVTRRHRSSILLVDDDPALALGYEHVLEASGYSVAVATDRTSAAQLAREQDFDVVVGDMDMEENHEGEALRGLSNHGRPVPVVVMSNGLAFARARAAVACGAYRYLVKPVSESRLLEVVVQAIQESAR